MAGLAVALFLVAAAGAWALPRRHDQGQVITGLTDLSWASFCSSAQRLAVDQQHQQAGQGTVVYPNDVSDYAALTASAPDTEVRDALRSARPFLLLAPLHTPTPIELHAGRQVAEALTAHCHLSSSIFGVILNRTAVTLPVVHGPASGQDEAAIRWALVGLTESEADLVAPRSGWTIRVVQRDGTNIVGDKSGVANRIGVVIRNGIGMSTSTG